MLPCRYASESTEFYSEVKNFRNLSSSSIGEDATSEQKSEHQAKLRRSAVEVVDEFVREGATHQINVPAAMRAQIETAVSGDTVDESVFDEAEKEIMSLMKKDTLPRFLQSDLFVKALADIGEASPFDHVPFKTMDDARSDFAALVQSTPCSNGGDDASALDAESSGNGAYEVNYG